MKDKALQLADLIDSDFDPDWMAEEGYDQIAAELRRLHSVNAELLVALKLAAEINPYGSVENATARDAACIAIAKATKELHK